MTGGEALRARLTELVSEYITDQTAVHALTCDIVAALTDDRTERRINAIGTALASLVDGGCQDVSIRLVLAYLSGQRDYELPQLAALAGRLPVEPLVEAIYELRSLWLEKGDNYSGIQ